MKKTFSKCVSLIIAAAMCLSLFPVTALAADGDFSINVYGTLIAYSGPGGDIVIPDGVKSIEKSVFRGLSSLPASSSPTV